MLEPQMQKQIQNQIRRNENISRFNLSSTSNHTHDGVDSLNVQAGNLIPSVSVSGRITFAQATDYTLNLNSNFTPTHITLYGLAYTTTGNFTFTLTSKSQATAGTVYKQGSSSYVVVTSVVSSLTIVLSGSEAPSSSGTLTKVIGSGNGVLDYSSVVDGTATGIRCMLQGSANLGPSFYFQPGSATSVVTGNIQYPFIDPNIEGNITVPLQSSMYLWVSTGPTTFKGQPGEGHIVDVQSGGTIYARATVTTFNKDKIIFHVSHLQSTWQIYANIIIT